MELWVAQSSVPSVAPASKYRGCSPQCHGRRRSSASLSPNKESSSGTYPPDYPRMKREFAVVAIRQGARNLCDTANFGPSTAGRLCFALVLAALLFGVSLAISFALESAAAFAIIQGLLVFGLALTIYSTLILGETHEQLASRHAQLDQELPTAEVAWIKHKTRVRAEPFFKEEESSPVPAPASTKNCPYCGELILDDARKCKHCGELLDPALRRSGCSTPFH